jgi:hypothetical protein
VQTNAEHQQDNADFRELENEVLIGNKTGRVRASYDTSKQITDEGGDFETGGNRAEDKRQT